MPELPEEVVCSVLEEAYYLHSPDASEYSGYHKPDYPTLLSCSLVNSTWNIPAQTLLFKSVIINDIFAAEFLGDTPSESDLLRHVRTLEIPASGFRGAQENIGLAIVTVLRRCLALYELVISAPGPISFPDAVLSDLREVMESRVKPLRSLRLNDGGVQSFQVYQLVSSFPTLEFLSIGSEIGRPPPKIYTCKARLYELRLSRNLPNDLLRWLLQASEGHLQVLELRDVPGRVMKDILSPHCASIRSLRFMPFNHISVDIVSMCTNLEELILMNIPSVFSIPTLPPSFRHMSIIFNLSRIGPRSTLAPIIEVVIAHPHMQSLRCSAVTKTIWDFPALEDVCRTHNVVLEVDGFNLWPSDVCVKARDFPRRRSVSNFRLMN